ncbi:MAG: hypothetical protein VW338_18640 [Rhodospirillaceae bacterium]
MPEPRVQPTAQDVVDALSQQRNDAMNLLADQIAYARALERRLAEAEAHIAELQAPAEPTKEEPADGV